MKRVFLLLAVLMALAMAAEPLPQILLQVHTTEAEVLSLDTAAVRITFLTSDGRILTLPVEGDAQEDLQNFARGNKVTLFCRDFERGEHHAVFRVLRR